MHHPILVRVVALLLSFPVGMTVAAELPFGHPDFYPTDERPVGFRADGNGAFPGAMPPDFTSLTEDFVVWKTAMDAPGMAAPLVVGEKVFVLGDPWMLYCLNVHDGSEVWRRSLSPAHDLPPPLARGLAEEEAYHTAVETARGRWMRRVIALHRKISDIGAQAADKQRQKLLRPHSPGNLLSTHKNNAPLVEAVMDLGDAIAAELAEVRKLGETNGFSYHEQENGIAFDKRKWRGWNQHTRVLYECFNGSSWYGYLTWSYMQPCSDGRHVFIATPQNCLACVDLDGELVWYRCLPQDTGTDGGFATRFVKSPILCGERIVLRADNRLLAVDKRSGRLLWQTNPEESWGGRPNPEAGQPVVMRLTTDGGESLDIVVDPGEHSKIYRLDDGRQLGVLPHACKAYYFLNRMAVGDLLISSAPDTRPEALAKDERARRKKKTPKCVMVERVRAPDRDTLRFEERWRRADLERLYAVVDGRVIAQEKGKGGKMRRVDLMTGEAEADQPCDFHGLYGWPVVGGTVQLHWGVDKRATFRNPDKRTVALTVFDVLGGARAVRLPPVLDETWARDEAWQDRWGYRSNMVYLNNASITPQANRHFLRTYGTTWCFGDPAAAFPVSDSWPAAARIGQSEPRVAPSPVPLAEVATVLRSGSQDRRLAAVATLAGVADAGALPNGLVADLVSQHAEAIGARRNDLARALGTIGPSAAAAAAALAGDVLEAENGMAINAGWALGRLGDGAQGALAPVAAWLAETAPKRLHVSKGEAPVKRLLAAGLAVGGIQGVEALDTIIGTASGNNKPSLQGARMVIAGTLSEGAHRPIPWPEVAE